MSTGSLSAGHLFLFIVKIHSIFIFIRVSLFTIHKFHKSLNFIRKQA